MNLTKRETLAYTPFIRKCENCGKEVRDHEPINFIVTIGSLGKKQLMGHFMQCPSEEHWGCSPECLEVIATACVKDHIIPFLKTLHEGVTE